MTTLNADKDAEKLDHPYIASGNVKWYDTLENNLEVSYKIKHAITSQSCNCTFGHLSQRNKSLCLHKKLYTNVQNSFICNSPKLQSAQMSFNRWLNSGTTHHRTLLSNKKEKTIDTHNIVYEWEGDGCGYKRAT